MTHPLFAYHGGEDALFAFEPDGKLLAAVRVRDLRRAGWEVDSISLARALPRLDPSPLDISPPSPATLPPAGRRR